MSKSQETFNKKEKEKQRAKKKKEKEYRREERKNNPTSSSLDDMMVYVDEFGNLVNTPPDLTNKKVINAEDIDITGVSQRFEEDLTGKKGVVNFFDTTKGFGFIRDLNSEEKYFVHANGLLEQIKENDKVEFELEQGPKGWNAINVKKVKIG
jgi:cold shock CspA family protein